MITGIARVATMQAEHIPAVIALASGEPTAPHWPPFEYTRMLQVIASDPARRGAWVLLLTQQHSDEPTLAGFCMAAQVAGICELEAVVVEQAWRGRRYGAELVHAAIAWARQSGATRLELEARAANLAARRLYERLGFLVDGVRPGYYCNPPEDAVLMSLGLQIETM